MTANGPKINIMAKGNIFLKMGQNMTEIGKIINQTVMAYSNMPMGKNTKAILKII